MLKSTENNAYCCYRFRDIEYAHSSSDNTLHVPSERQKQVFESEIRELERRKDQKQTRLAEIQEEANELTQQCKEIGQAIDKKKKQCRELEVQDIQWMEQRLQEMKLKVLDNDPKQ
mmetsp:Transcript_11665/g.15356  ORF Transcript_11665/g.15356 Transcript_11665/m.15356 type:complete len:116 (+) Transcript_11665:3-350(+)